MSLVGSRTPSISGAEPLRVMVVDDSAVIRGLITRNLEASPNVHVVASVGNGQMAVSQLERNDIEVIVLDIEMPVMDGLTALPKLLELDPHIQVIVASTLTLRNADISMRCLEAGAKDYIPKPTATREISGESDFKRELLDKVTALGANRRRLPKRTVTSTGLRPIMPRPAGPVIPKSLYTGSITLRQAATEPPDIIAIGSSTGGPQALFAVLTGMKSAGLTQPIMITQHMPATFTTILAEHITRQSGWQAAEGVDGEAIRSGRVYVAPGDFHMVLESKGTERVIRINKNPPENFCRPAVDPMFRSISQIYGKRVLAVILTGMGQDGMKGGQQIVAGGGTVIAQDEATSVVWGMPGAAATSGICSAVLPLPEIANYVVKLAARRG
jgi:two-component system chemotaxis response regulator CheB